MTEPADDAKPDETGSEPEHNPEAASAEAPEASKTQPPSEATPPADVAVAASDAAPQEQFDEDDELPEYEPLTPELVEEEAIRGDFMLRWFLILLAALFACSEIAETRTLMHVASGRYLSDNGWLPPANDVFSSTATDRAWTNLSWLFDLLTAGLFSAGGATALSVTKILIGGLTFGLLVHISRAEISSWWGTVCAALAAVACYPQFTWQPEVVTLLGVTVTLWLFHHWREQKGGWQLWLLIPMFAVWSNLDPRMYLGVAVLVFYAAGEAVGNWLGRPGLPEGPSRRQLWLVTAGCIGAALINPFGWQSLLSPLSLYGIEYPALRQFAAGAPDWQNYPLASPTFWSNLDAFSIAGLLLMAATVISFGLNWSRLDFGEVCLFLGMGGFTIVGSHELAVASVVCCVLATWNGQSWYRSSVRQTYSVAMGELLFSRGGRAVTVIGLFSLAYLATSGRLTGTGVGRAGVGFSPALQSTIEGLEQDLEGSFDDRPFNCDPRQGDVLAFLDYKVFADSRMALYCGTEPNLIQLQAEVAQALGQRRPDLPNSGRPEVWTKTLDEYEITHVAVPMQLNLSQAGLYFDLLKSPQWQLTRLGSVASVFYRSNIDGTEGQAFLDEHRINFLEDAFRKPIKKKDLAYRVDWARPRSVYQKYLTVPRRTLSNALRRAVHYDLHLEATSQGGMFLDNAMLAAMSHLVIRNANEALSEDPNDAIAFLLLGNAYRYLGQVEGQFTSRGANAPQRERRVIEAICSYRQAVTVNPQYHQAYRKLIELYDANGNKLDLTLEAIEDYLRCVSKRDDLLDAEIEVQERLSLHRTNLENRVEDTKAQVAAAQAKQADVLTLARMAYRGGCANYALDLLDGEPNFLALNPDAQLMQAQLLLEAGRAEDASLALGKLEGIADRYPNLDWRWPYALTYLANGRYNSAIVHLSEKAEEAKEREITGILQSMPLVSSPTRWPLQQTNKVMTSLYLWPVQRAQSDLNVALSYIESGEVDLAEETLRRTIEENPNTPMRSITLFYLTQLTDEKFDLQPPSDWIPITPDMFESEAIETAED